MKKNWKKLGYLGLVVLGAAVAGAGYVIGKKDNAVTDAINEAAEELAEEIEEEVE